MTARAVRWVGAQIAYETWKITSEIWAERARGPTVKLACRACKGHTCMTLRPRQNQICWIYVLMYYIHICALHRTKVRFLDPTRLTLGFPGGSVVMNLPVNAGDAGDSSWLERSSWRGNSNPLQYSCLKTSTDKGAWWAVVHGVAKSRTQLSIHSLLPLGYSVAPLIIHAVDFQPFVVTVILFCYLFSKLVLFGKREASHPSLQLPHLCHLPILKKHRTAGQRV